MEKKNTVKRSARGLAETNKMELYRYLTLSRRSKPLSVDIISGDMLHLKFIIIIITIIIIISSSSSHEIVEASLHCKSKDVPVHAINAYGGSRSTAPFSLNLGTRLR